MSGLGNHRSTLLVLSCLACGGTPARAPTAAALPSSGVAPIASAPAPSAADALAPPRSFAPTSWQILGPFDNPWAKDGKSREGMARDYLRTLGGEAGAVLDGKSSVREGGNDFRTRAVKAPETGIVDLIPVYEGQSDMKVAYAYGEVTLDAPTNALALFGSDDAAVVWVNGREVHRAMKDRAVNPDEDRFSVSLVQGKNRILIKVDNAGGGWGFAFRVYDEAGKRRLEALDLRRHLERIEVRPKEGRFVLQGGFPELGFVYPAGAPPLLSEPSVRWFDAALSEVTEPARPGRYLALVEARTRDGAPHRRLLTFAKLESEEILPWIPYEPWGSPPIVELPWGRELSRAAHQELSRHMWRVTQDSFWEDESGAILALAISELDPKLAKDRAQPWYELARARDVQHKLDLRMKLEGRTPKPFAPPVRLAEKAGVLRPGSELRAGMKPGARNALRTLFRAWAEADKNGFVVVMARKGVVFLHEAYNGFDQASTFHPASIAKTISGLTFARAVEQGLLGFDQPLSSVFPAYAGDKTRAVTFRHCFYHLTGLGEHHSHGGLFNPLLDEDVAIQDFPFVEPGTRFVYGGDGINLANTALSLVTGRSMFRLFHEHLQAPFAEPVEQFDGASGTRFSAMYLAKVGQMILQDGKYGDHQFYSPGFLRELLPKNASAYAPRLDDKKLESGIGLGWMHDPDGPREQGVLGPNVVGHGSGSGVYWRVALDHDLVIVVGRNAFSDWKSNEDWGDRLAAKVAENIAK